MGGLKTQSKVKRWHKIQMYETGEAIAITELECNESKAEDENISCAMKLPVTQKGASAGSSSTNI